MRVVGDVQFDGPRALDRVHPAIAERAELDPGGIQDAHGIGHVPAGAAGGGGGHVANSSANILAGRLAWHRPGSCAPRGGRPHDRAGMTGSSAPPRSPASSRRRTVARTARPGTGSWWKPAARGDRTCAFAQDDRTRPTNLLLYLMKNAIVVAHGIDLLLVSQTRPNVQNRVESMSCSLSTKLNRTAMGLTRWPMMSWRWRMMGVVR